MIQQLITDLWKRHVRVKVTIQNQGRAGVIFIANVGMDDYDGASSWPAFKFEATASSMEGLIKDIEGRVKLCEPMIAAYCLHVEHRIAVAAVHRAGDKLRDACLS